MRLNRREALKATAALALTPLVDECGDEFETFTMKYDTGMSYSTRLKILSAWRNSHEFIVVGIDITFDRSG